MEINDPNPIPASFDPETGSDYYFQPQIEDADIDFEKWVNDVSQSYDETLDQSLEIFTEAVVDKTTSEDFTQVNQVISFLIEHLDPSTYPKEVQELQKLLRVSPLLRLVQIKAKGSQVVSFILDQIKNVDEKTLAEWMPDYEEFDKPSYFKPLLKLAILYHSIDILLAQGGDEALLEEIIAELLQYEDFNKALSTAKKIKNAHLRNRCLDRIASTLAKATNLKRALEGASDLEKADQFYLFHRLTKDLCEIKAFDQAIDLIDRLNKEGQHETDRFSSEVAHSLFLDDNIEKALIVASRMKKESVKLDTLIANTTPENIEQAKKIALTLSPDKKARAMIFLNNFSKFKKEE